MQHALIIGGGLAGPALAIALARRGMASTIFEIRTVAGDSGGSISLAPNALRALDKGVGVYNRILAAGFAYERAGAYSDDGYKLGDIVVSTADYPTVRIMRSAIHHALLDAVAECPDKIKIKWGANIRRIESGKDSVTAFFEDGSSATGDVLIGADGIHSKVREHVLGAAAPTPTFSGSCTISGFVPKAAVVPLPGMTFPAAIFTPIGLVMALPVDPEGKTLAYGVSEEIEEKTREGFKEYETSGAAARAAKAHYNGYERQPIRSLLDNTDDTGVRLWAPYSIPDLPTWHKGRVCLIGDAAHALPPNGQGSAQAFEDAVYLARLLDSDKTAGFEVLFDRFEQARRPRIERVKQLSKNAGRSKSAAGPWVWWAKKWAMWAYFAWNRWEMKDDRVFAYDVMAEP